MRPGVEGAVFLRCGLGALLLLAITRPTLRGRSRADLLLLVLLGALLATMNSAFYQAVDRLPLGIAVTVEFLGPLGVAVAASRRRLDVLWVAMAGTGVALFAGAPSDSSVTAAGLGVRAGGGGRVGRLHPHRKARGHTLAGLRRARREPGGGDCSARTDRRSGRHFGAPRWLSARPRGGRGSVLDRVSLQLELAALRRMPARVYGVLASLEPVAGAAVGIDRAGPDAECAGGTGRGTGGHRLDRRGPIQLAHPRDRSQLRLARWARGGLRSGRQSYIDVR